MENILVSAVITTCNRSVEIVKRAFCSVVEQTYASIEIIVIDDSSSDFSECDKIKKLVQAHPQAKYYRNETNIGACASRNRGLSYANGDFVAFLDDDDEWLPTKIEKQLEVFWKNKDVALVYCGYIKKNIETNREEVTKTVFFSGNVIKPLLRKNFIGSTSFPLIKTEVLKDLGGFDVLMKSAQDYDMWTRIAYQNSIDYVEEPLAIYYIHNGIQITKNPNNKIEGLERYYEKNRLFIEKDSVAKYNRIMATVIYYSMIGNKKTAIQKWIKGALIRPFSFTNNIKELYRIFKYGYYKNEFK